MDCARCGGAREARKHVTRWLAFACGLLATAALADDWRETLTPPEPGRFPALRPLTATYKFGWSGLTAADATFDFARVKGGRLRLAVNAKTVGVVRGLWRMDAQHVAVCDAATLLPVSLRDTTVYKDETEFAEVNFTSDGVERWLESKPAGATPPRWKRVALQNVFDLHSALLFVRSQPMRVGDVYRLVVYPSKRAYLAEIEVRGREPLRMRGKDYTAIRCEVRLQGVTKKLELEPHGKFKRAYAWLSDDRDRLLLKAEAELSVGAVWVELAGVKFADSRMGSVGVMR